MNLMAIVFILFITLTVMCVIESDTCPLINSLFSFSDRSVTPTVTSSISPHTLSHALSVPS